MDQNNKLYNQQVGACELINVKLDENVMILAVCIIELTIEKRVVLELSEHLYYPSLYSLCFFVYNLYWLIIVHG